MKKMIKMYLAIGSFAIGLPVMAQQQAQMSPIKTIDISESEEIEVFPNKITLRIILKERTEGKNQDPISIKGQEDSLRKILKTMKIEASKLSVVEMNTSFENVRKRKDAVTTKVFNLELTKYSEQNRVFQKLDDWKVFSAYVEKYEHSQFDSLILEINKKALFKAKKNAQYILSGIGEVILNPLEIRFDNVNLNYDFKSIQMRGSRMDAAQTYVDGINETSDSEEQPLELKKIKIKSNVFVKFQIK